MKKIILIFALTGISVSMCTTAFGQEDKKVVKAKKEVVEAKKDLKVAQNDLAQAKNDSIEDYKKFKMEAEIQINENNKKIAELKAKKSDATDKDARARYDKRVLALEQRNIELKKKLDGASTVKTSNWPSFKREFNHDMEEFGSAFKNIGVDNAK